MSTNQTGTVLTCSGENCDSRLVIERPCPHGDVDTCACGRPLQPVGLDQSDLPVTPGA